MKKKLESPFLKREVRVELVSLMDVMFLVLVFFVYSIFDMAVHHGLKVDLPTAIGTLEKGERIDLNNSSKIIAVTYDTSLKLPYKGGRTQYTYVVTALDRMSNESKGKKKKVKL